MRHSFDEKSLHLLIHRLVVQINLKVAFWHVGNSNLTTSNRPVVTLLRLITTDIPNERVILGGGSIRAC